MIVPFSVTDFIERAAAVYGERSMKSVTLKGTIMRPLWHAPPTAARSRTGGAPDGTGASTSGPWDS